jgi:DNA repair exonuclease SbcCD ATPase subunit
MEEINMKKQIKSFFVLAILILSMMQIAYAENDTEDTKPPLSVKKVGATLRPVAAKVRANLNFSDRNKTLRINATQIRDKYKLAVAKYANVKDKDHKARSILNETKKHLSACKDGDSEECLELKRKTKHHSKEFLINSAEKVLAFLERLKEKVESSEELDEDQMEDILSKLEENIAEIEDAKDVVENLDNESTTEELRNAAETIKKAWKRVQTRSKWAIGKLTNAKIHGIIIRSEKLVEKLEKISERFDENEQDTTELDALIEDFGEKIELAKEQYRLALEKYQEALDDANPNEIVKEANAYMKEAHKYLRESHKVLKQIHEEIKDLKQENTPEPEEEVE